MDVKIRVHVNPGSKKSEIQKFDEWKNVLVVKVKSPPEKGKANRELVELLSDFFSTEVYIVSGQKSRNKIIVVRGLSEKEAYDRLRKI